MLRLVDGGGGGAVDGSGHHVGGKHDSALDLDAANICDVPSTPANHLEGAALAQIVVLGGVPGGMKGFPGLNKFELIVGVLLVGHREIDKDLVGRDKAI